MLGDPSTEVHAVQTTFLHSSPPLPSHPLLPHASGAAWCPGKEVGSRSFNEQQSLGYRGQIYLV